MNLKTKWRAAASGLFMLLLSACGGSSGGGAVTTQPVGQTPAGTPALVAVPAEVSAATCAVNLGDLVDATNGVVPGGVITDRGPGCDYFVDNRTTIAGDVGIAPGVTVVLGPGASLFFNGGSFNSRTSSVQLLGTAAAPIAFISSSGAGAWDSIEFRADELVMTNVGFEGGGLSADDEDGAVQIDALSLAMSSVSVGGSNSNGLLLTGNETDIPVFQNNQFVRNRGYGLLLSDISFTNFLSTSNNFGTGDGANLISGIGVLNTFNSDGIVIQEVGVPYHILGGSSLSSAGAFDIDNVFISAGVEFQLPAENGLSLNSATVAGTVENPVVFAGIDGTAWGGVTVEDRFAREPESFLQNVVILNAGSGEGSGGGALVLPNEESAILENITITGSANWGIFCEGAASADTPVTVFQGITITDSSAGDVHPDCNLTIEDAISTAAPTFDVNSCAEQLVTFSSNTPFQFSNTDALCDYFVVGELSITSTAQIEAGTTIVFARGASLEISNTLVANGTAQAPITLRGEVESDGYWQGVTLSGRGHSLQYVNIVDGGFVGELESPCNIGCEFEPGIALSIPLVASNQTVATDIVMDNVTISGSLGDGLSVGTGVNFSQFTNNTFIGNAGFGAVMGLAAAVSTDQTSLYDSAMAPNGNTGVRLLGIGTSSANNQVIEEVSILPNISAPWVSETIAIFSGQTLEISAGNTIYFDSDAVVGVNSGGTLTIAGTATEPVVLSGLPGDASNWIGVNVAGQLTASNAEIIGGANEESFSGAVGLFSTTTSDGAIQINRGSVNLTDITIRDSLQWGIACIRTSVENLVLSNISYSNNSSGNIQLECGES